MSQHDYIIADASGSAFLADLNLAVKALAENNYGTTEPSVMYAHMWWADTTANILKKRNAANTGWISYLTLSTGALLGQGLGTPASGVLTNCTGTAAGLSIGGNAATATTATSATTATTATTATNNVLKDSGSSAIGVMLILQNTSGSDIASNSTGASGLYYSRFDITGVATAISGASGIWRNISGVTIINGSYGMFQRIS